MALVKCPECGKEVSSEAPTCPHCGRPIASTTNKVVSVKRKGGKYELIGFLLIVGGIFSFLISPLWAFVLMGIGFVVFLIGRFM